MVRSESAAVASIAELSVAILPVRSFASFHLYLVTFYSALSGFLFGYDTGIVSGALLLLKRHFRLTSVWQECVVSITILGAWMFSFAASAVTERFGRKPSILICSVWFAVGSVVMAAAEHVWIIVLGRFIVGAAIGLSSAIVPMYIAEVATPSMRGKLVTFNNCLVTGGQFIASITAGAFSEVPDGWRYMLGLAAIPSLIQSVGFLFAPESPRWLVRKGRLQEARLAFTKLRSKTSDIEAEFEAIRVHCSLPDAKTPDNDEVHDVSSTSQAKQPKSHNPSLWHVLRHEKAVRQALLVGCVLQLVQQLAGINTIMYYSASIIEMSGVHDPSRAIWLSSLTSLTNFLFTLVGFYLVERIGRRRLTLSSLFGVCVTLFMLSFSFYLVKSNSPAIVYNHHSSSLSSSSSFSSTCSRFTSCSDCVASPDCGFCFQSNSDSRWPMNGTCLPVRSSTDHDSSLNGSCAANAVSNSDVWAYNWCPSPYSWLIVLSLIVYLMCFAPGIGPMAWTINAEIYPMRCRSLCFGFSTSLNWLSNLIVSFTFLSLMEGLGEMYTFLLYLVVTAFGFVFFWFRLPETKGRNLEDIERLFGGSALLAPTPSSDYGTRQPVTASTSIESEIGKQTSNHRPTDWSDSSTTSVDSKRLNHM